MSDWVRFDANTPQADIDAFVEQYVRDCIDDFRDRGAEEGLTPEEIESSIAQVERITRTQTRLAIASGIRRCVQ
jgi:hypothetical protein